MTTFRLNGQLTIDVVAIDNCPDTVWTVAQIFRRSGFSVATVIDATTALDVIRATQPRFALIDVSMPRLSGYEIARRLRKDPVIGATFLVAYTGWALPQHRLEALDAGFDLHWAKPAPLSDLATLFKELDALRQTA